MEKIEEKTHIMKNVILNPKLDSFPLKFKQASRDHKLATYKLRSENEESLIDNKDTATFM